MADPMDIELIFDWMKPKQIDLEKKTENKKDTLYKDSKDEFSEFVNIKKRKTMAIVPYIDRTKPNPNTTLVPESDTEKNERTIKRNFKILPYVFKCFKIIPNIPFIIFEYLYSIYSILMISITIYTLLSSFLILNRDIQNKINARKIEIAAFVKKCEYNYKINRCDPKTRVPALENICNKWECGIQKNVDSVEILRLVAEVFGDFLDSFINKISYRSVGFVLTFFIVYLLLRNRNR